MPKGTGRGFRDGRWPVDLMGDGEKIQQLRRAQGWPGVCIYYFLCLMAVYYNGYFIPWSYPDSSIIARMMGGGIGSETVRSTVGACCQIGLFDKRLFERSAVLTNKGLQKNYLAAQEKRQESQRNSLAYWLLENENSRGLVKCAQNEKLQEKTENGKEEAPHPPPFSSPSHSPISIPPIIPPEEERAPLTCARGHKTKFSPEMQRVVKTWIQYQQEKGQGYTESGIRMLQGEVLRNTETYGEEPVIRVIRESMASNYAGILFSRLREERERYARDGDAAAQAKKRWKIRYNVDGRSGRRGPVESQDAE